MTTKHLKKAGLFLFAFCMAVVLLTACNTAGPSDANTKEDPTTPTECTHSFENWTVTKEAGCITTGVQSRTCKDCGFTETNSLIALGHTEVVDAAKAATCDEAGKTEGKHCSACSAVLVPSSEIPATGHTWQEATCKQPKTCSACSKTEGTVADHSFGQWSVTEEATEEKEGSKERICTICEHKETETIPTLDHEHSFGEEWETNETLHWHLCRCGKKSDKAEHTFGDWTTTKNENCTEDGRAERACTVCGQSESKTLPMTGHKPVTDAALDATCEQAGKTEGSHCELCSEVLTAQTEIPATGHSWTEATCEKAKTCSACQKTEGGAKGHYWRAATCESPKTCYNCFKTEGSAKGHSWAPATCESPKTCYNCSKTEGNAKGHTYVDKVCTVCKQLKPSEGLKFTSDGSSYTVSGIGSCRDEELVIPEKYNGKPVTKIGEGCFKNLSKIKSVVIPASVTNIEKEAFYGCIGLSEITLPDGLHLIGNSAFYNCTSLDNITLPDGLWSIGNDAFANCTSLNSITIPEDITSIYSSTFENCTALKRVTISEGLKYIGSSAFEGCTSLTAIIIPGSTTGISAYAFKNCTSLKSVSFPNRDGWTELDIGYNAFENCTTLTSIQIPDGVTEIDSSTFRGCKNLVSVKLPDGITSIGKYAFYGCESLPHIHIPTGVTRIEEYTFYGCKSLNNVILPDLVEYIGSYSFADCIGLERISIPDRVTTIDHRAFSGCTSLESIIIPNSVKTIGSHAFTDLKTAWCEASSQPEGWAAEYYLNWYGYQDDKPTIYWGDSWHFVNGFPAPK